MNIINANNLNLISNYASLLKNKISQNLTTKHLMIFIIASYALGLIAVCYTLCRSRETNASSKEKSENVKAGNEDVNVENDKKNDDRTPQLKEKSEG